MSNLQKFLKKWSWVLILAGGGGACVCCSGCELLGLQTDVMKPAACSALLLGDSLEDD